MDTNISTNDGTKTYISLGTKPYYSGNNSHINKNHQFSPYIFDCASEQSSEMQHSRELQSFGEINQSLKSVHSPNLSTQKCNVTTYQIVCENKPQPIKKYRKQRNKNTPSRTENKLNRNSNKPYINHKGVEVAPRTFIDYDCDCPRRCNIRLSSSLRKFEFNKFWSLCTYNAQTAFICAKISEYPVKRSYGKIMGNAKSFSRSYSLFSVPVCRNMFLKTIQVSSGRVNTALKKMRTKTSIEDQRGKNQLKTLKHKNLQNEMEKNYLQQNKNSHNLASDCQNVNNLEESHGLESSVNKNNENRNGFKVDSTIGLLIPISQQFDNSASTVCSLDRSIYENTNNSNVIVTKDKYFVAYPLSKTDEIIPLTVSKENCNILLSVDRPRKGRKPKYSQSRSQNKANRNNNKAYINYKGVLVEPKRFNDFYCECTRKCSFLLPKNERLKEFEKFWALSYDSQTAFIVAAVSEHPVKRRYSQESEKKKDFTRKYSMGSFSVCRELFCKTLNISPGRINTALKKFRSQTDLSDQRGTKQGGHNKLPAEKLNSVIRFMKRVPVYKSHHCKKKKKSRFLSPDLTLSKLYDIYKKEEKMHQITKASFKKIFYKTFNLRNRQTCQVCDHYNKKQGTEQDIIKINELKTAYNKHITIVSAAQNLFEYDMMLAKKYADIECITIRMGKTLPLPRMSSNLIWYKRLLWLYNLSIYSSKKDQSYSYVWPEGQGGKGCQEVGSCLLKHAKEEIVWFNEINHLIIWTESHGGLMRNIRIALLLQTLLQSCINLKSIKLKFMISSHSSFQNQKDLTDIEKSLKAKNELYTVDDYINVIRASRKKRPIIVKLVRNQELFSTAQIEKQISLNDSINWTEVDEMTMLAQDPFVLYLKNNVSSEVYKENIATDITSDNITNFNQYLVSLWPLGKPITPSKLKDLKSILHLMPEKVVEFYTNLQCGTINDEDVDGFNEILDFKPELSRS